MRKVMWSVGVIAFAVACEQDLTITKTLPDTPDEEEPIDAIATPQPDITLTPETLAFGLRPPGCISEVQTVTITNDGDADLDITDIALTGNGKDAYIAKKIAPRVLAPGESHDVEVQFDPIQLIKYNAPKLRVQSNDPDEPNANADLRGEGAPAVFADEIYTQDQQSNVDVLWTLDNSCSMAGSTGEIAQLADAFGTFITNFVALGLDYHITVISTDAQCSEFREYDDGGTMRKVIDQSTANPVDAFTDLALQSGGCGDEAGFSATQAALSNNKLNGVNSGFLRTDASLAIVAVSDEPEQSGSPNPQGYSNWLAGLKGGDMSLVSFSAITGPDGAGGGLIPTGGCPVSSGSDATTAPRYHKAIRQTGGVWGDLCNFDVDPFLNHLSFVAAGLEYRFELGREPASTNPTVITVTVDGVEVDWDLFEGWTYDADENAIEFHGSSIPDPGAVITIRYPHNEEC